MEVNDGANRAASPHVPSKCVAGKDKALNTMPLEDEINARLRRHTEEIKNSREDNDQLRRERLLRLGRHEPHPGKTPSTTPKTPDK